jgi:hypothetical protein
MAKRSRMLVFGSVLTPVALVLGGSMMVESMDKQGWRFFNVGKDLTEVLREVAEGLKARDMERIGRQYDPSFRGARLGLNRLEQVEERDGVRRFRFRSDGDAPSRDAALSEWQTYADSFDELEETGLFVHRVEQWDSDTEYAASVRFEVIGRLKGESQSVIDRGLFRMRFAPSADGLRIRSAELLEVERFAGGAPPFAEVGAQAGIAFENRYYPDFLNKELKFAMIRYGPGGITAVGRTTTTASTISSSRTASSPACSATAATAPLRTSPRSPASRAWTA